MNTRIFLAMTTCFAVNLAAQQAQTKGKMGVGMMADHMSDMKGEHREMAQLVEKITQSFAAIQAEKDPAVLSKKLADHAALLKQLDAKVQAGTKMMEKMEKEDAAAPEHKH
ncbi:MAG: hypothetical protein ABIR70_16910 [Bryobacteraceae bacterium]